MESKNKVVSVIIPTYNRSGLIARSAKSVLNQTYKNLELIIVDDGSTDNTEDVVNNLNDERVIYIKQANQGACAARNNGICHAKGDFVAFQDSDDVWHTDKLEKQLETLEKTNADVVVCGCNVWCNNKFIHSYLKYNNSFLDKEKWPFGIGTQSILGKSEVFKDINFDNNIRRWQDFEILVRIQEKYTIYCSRDLLVDYFGETDSISRSYKNLLNTLETIFLRNEHSIRLCRKYNNDLAINILHNIRKCNDIETKNRILELSFKISNNPSYIKCMYYLSETRLYSFAAKIFKTVFELFNSHK